MSMVLFAIALSLAQGRICQKAPESYVDGNHYHAGAPLPIDTMEDLPFEARRIHWAVTHGIMPNNGAYDGKTLPVNWAISYKCEWLEQAIEALRPCAERYTVTLECASRINAQRWAEFLSWKLNNFDPWMATAWTWIGIPPKPDATRGCYGKHMHCLMHNKESLHICDQLWDETRACFMQGHCEGCLNMTITRVHLVKDSRAQ